MHTIGAFRLPIEGAGAFWERGARIGVWCVLHVAARWLERKAKAGARDAWNFKQKDLLSNHSAFKVQRITRMHTKYNTISNQDTFVAEIEDWPLRWADLGVTRMRVAEGVEIALLGVAVARKTKYLEEKAEVLEVVVLVVKVSGPLSVSSSPLFLVKCRRPGKKEIHLFFNSSMICWAGFPSK